MLPADSREAIGESPATIRTPDNTIPSNSAPDTAEICPTLPDPTLEALPRLPQKLRRSMTATDSCSSFCISESSALMVMNAAENSYHD
jgi:hypothetical protein